MTFTRPIDQTWDLQPLTGYAMATQSRKARWSRGTVVRAGAPVFFLPPLKVMFDPTDPNTFKVKGSGYRPY